MRMLIACVVCAAMWRGTFAAAAPKPDPADETIAKAQAAYSQHAKDEALALYREIVEKHPQSRHRAIAQYNIGIVLRDQKKYDDAIVAFQALIKSDANDMDPGSNIMEVYRNYRHRASLRIATCYEAQQKHAQALRYLELARDKYRYQSWCGTCQDSAHQSLQFRIERCLLHLRRHEDAMEMCLADFTKTQLSSQRVELLVAVYHAAGQESDLQRILESIETRSSPADILELLRIYEYERDNNFAGLIALIESPRACATELDHPTDETLVPRAAALALGRCGMPAFVALREHAVTEGTNDWIVYGIANCRVPEALPWLVAHAEAQENFSSAEHAALAFSLQGEAGQAALQRMAERSRGNLKTAAKRRLEQMSETANDQSHWPAPVAGSLPKRWPLAPLTIDPQP